VLTYEHDWSSRLLDISTADGSVARFTYDPLGRRVEATVNGVSTYRAPFGSQEVAAYVEDTNGDLQERKRLYWGDGVDHLLAYDWDSDLDGSLESRLYPLTDDKGTVQGVADADGTVVESYVYRPDGSFRIFGTDQTVPELLLARVRPAGGDRPAQRMELVFSEKVQLGDGTLELRDGSGSPIFDNADWSKSADGRRWWVDIDPPLVEGDSYTLYLTGLEDTTGNRMAVAQPIDESFTVPAETDELDLPLGGEGDILAVIDAQNTLVLVSGSPIDPASLSGASLSLMRNTTQVTGTLSLYDTAAGGSGDVPGYEGRILVWTPDDPSLYQPADYEATILLSLTDPAGHQIHAPPSGLTFSHAGEADIVWAKASETPPLSASTSSNDRFLHGRPYIQPLGLYDYRARFYEPSTSTFIEPDPLGPVDSPNLYQAFGFDGLNVRDPSGMGGPFGDHMASNLAIRRSNLDPETKQELLKAQNEAEQRAVGLILKSVGTAQEWAEEQVVEYTPLNEADIAFLEMYTATDPEAVGNAVKGLVAGAERARTVLRESKLAHKLVGLVKKSKNLRADSKAVSYRPHDVLPNGRVAGAGPGAMLKGAPTLPETGDAIVLGQNMEHRVIPAAEKLSAGYLKTPPSEWTWAKNRAFLYRNLQKVKEGTGRILDVGWEQGRYHGPRAVYTREARYLTEHGLERVFTGKWITASNGRRFRVYEWRLKK
jgi:RHS repeat-associated protein